MVNIAEPAGTNYIEVNTTQGCPQALSPRKWSILVDETMVGLTNAYGITLVCSGKYEDTLCGGVESGLKINRSCY